MYKKLGVDLMKDLLGLGKLSENSVELIKMIYPDLAQPAVKKVGLALETTLDLGNTILLPFKLINSKSNIWFENSMKKYKEKLDKVPDEEIINVPPEIGLKIIDELLKLTNEDIAELFIELLTCASNINTVKNAHPSFITVIKNISSDEARIINNILKNNNEILYSYIGKSENIPLTSRENNLEDLVELEIIENNYTYIENLIKLGILENNEFFSTANEIKYEELFNIKLKDKYEELNREVEKLNLENVNKVSIDIYKGQYGLTEYGKSFILSLKSGGSI